VGDFDARSLSRWRRSFDALTLAQPLHHPDAVGVVEENDLPSKQPDVDEGAGFRCQGTLVSGHDAHRNKIRLDGKLPKQWNTDRFPDEKLDYGGLPTQQAISWSLPE